MNKMRRAEIEKARELIQTALDKLDQARSLLTDIKDQEEEARENLPESLQDGERGEAMQAAIDALESAESEIDLFDFDGVFNSLDEAVQS